VLKKILVVDDSAAIHQIYQITLARYKCPVLSALNGQEGLNQLALNPDINLLIVDMHMQPHMSGLEFINRVKEQEAFNNIPIIAVLLRAKDGEDSKKVLNLAEGILKKPFTSREIHLEIERLFPESVLEPKT
jgi:two-component system chemotaxis response regulator CheY